MASSNVNIRVKSSDVEDNGEIDSIQALLNPVSSFLVPTPATQQPPNTPIQRKGDNAEENEVQLYSRLSKGKNEVITQSISPSNVSVRNPSSSLCSQTLQYPTPNSKASNSTSDNSDLVLALQNRTLQDENTNVKRLIRRRDVTISELQTEIVMLNDQIESMKNCQAGINQQISDSHSRGNGIVGEMALREAREQGDLSRHRCEDLVLRMASAEKDIENLNDICGDLREINSKLYAQNKDLTSQLVNEVALNLEWEENVAQHFASVSRHVDKHLLHKCKAGELADRLEEHFKQAEVAYLERITSLEMDLVSARKLCVSLEKHLTEINEELTECHLEIVSKNDEIESHVSHMEYMMREAESASRHIEEAAEKSKNTSDSNWESDRKELLLKLQQSEGQRSELEARINTIEDLYQSVAENVHSAEIERVNLVSEVERLNIEITNHQLSQEYIQINSSENKSLENLAMENSSLRSELISLQTTFESSVKMTEMLQSQLETHRLESNHERESMSQIIQQIYKRLWELSTTLSLEQPSVVTSTISFHDCLNVINVIESHFFLSAMEKREELIRIQKLLEDNSTLSMNFNAASVLSSSTISELNNQIQDQLLQLSRAKVENESLQNDLQRGADQLKSLLTFTTELQNELEATKSVSSPLPKSLDEHNLKSDSFANQQPGDKEVLSKLGIQIELFEAERARCVDLVGQLVSAEQEIARLNELNSIFRNILMQVGQHYDKFKINYGNILRDTTDVDSDSFAENLLLSMRDFEHRFISLLASECEQSVQIKVLKEENEKISLMSEILGHDLSILREDLQSKSRQLAVLQDSFIQVVKMFEFNIAKLELNLASSAQLKEQTEWHINHLPLFLDRNREVIKLNLRIGDDLLSGLLQNCVTEISNLQLQISSLERENENTRMAMAAAEEHVSLSFQDCVNEVTKLQLQISTMEKENSELRITNERVSESFENSTQDLVNEISKLQLQISTMENENSELRIANDSVFQSLEKSTDVVGQLRLQILSLEKEAQAANDQCVNLVGQVVTAEQEIFQLHDRVENITRDFHARVIELECNIQSKDAEMKQLRSQFALLELRCEELQVSVDQLAKCVDGKESRIEKLTEELNESVSQKLHLQYELDKLEVTSKTLSEQLRVLKRSRDEQISELNSMHQDSSLSFYEVFGKLEEANAEIDHLKYECANHCEARESLALALRAAHQVREDVEHNLTSELNAANHAKEVVERELSLALDAANKAREDAEIALDLALKASQQEKQDYEAALNACYSDTERHAIEYNDECRRGDELESLVASQDIEIDSLSHAAADAKFRWETELEVLCASRDACIAAWEDRGKSTEWLIAQWSSAQLVAVESSEVVTSFCSRLRDLIDQANVNNDQIKSAFYVNEDMISRIDLFCAALQTEKDTIATEYIVMETEMSSLWQLSEALELERNGRNRDISIMKQHYDIILRKVNTYCEQITAYQIKVLDFGFAVSDLDSKLSSVVSSISDMKQIELKNEKCMLSAIDSLDCMTMDVTSLLELSNQLQQQNEQRKLILLSLSDMWRDISSTVKSHSFNSVCQTIQSTADSVYESNMHLEKLDNIFVELKNISESALIAFEEANMLEKKNESQLNFFLGVTENTMEQIEKWSLSLNELSLLVYKRNDKMTSFSNEVAEMKAIMVSQSNIFSECQIVSIRLSDSKIVENIHRMINELEIKYNGITKQLEEERKDTEMRRKVANEAAIASVRRQVDCHEGSIERLNGDLEEVEHVAFSNYTSATQWQQRCEDLQLQNINLIADNNTLRCEINDISLIASRVTFSEDETRSIVIAAESDKKQKILLEQSIERLETKISDLRNENKKLTELLSVAEQVKCHNVGDIVIEEPISDDVNNDAAFWQQREKEANARTETFKQAVEELLTKVSAARHQFNNERDAHEQCRRAVDNHEASLKQLSLKLSDVESRNRSLESLIDMMKEELENLNTYVISLKDNSNNLKETLKCKDNEIYDKTVLVNQLITDISASNENLNASLNREQLLAADIQSLQSSVHILQLSVELTQKASSDTIQRLSSDFDELFQRCSSLIYNIHEMCRIFEELKGNVALSETSYLSIKESVVQVLTDGQIANHRMVTIVNKAVEYSEILMSTIKGNLTQLPEMKQDDIRQGIFPVQDANESSKPSNFSSHNLGLSQTINNVLVNKQCPDCAVSCEAIQDHLLSLFLTSNKRECDAADDLTVCMKTIVEIIECNQTLENDNGHISEILCKMKYVNDCNIDMSDGRMAGLSRMNITKIVDATHGLGRNDIKISRFVSPSGGNDTSISSLSSRVSGLVEQVKETLNNVNRSAMIADANALTALCATASLHASKGHGNSKSDNYDVVHYISKRNTEREKDRRRDEIACEKFLELLR